MSAVHEFEKVLEAHFGARGRQRAATVLLDLAELHLGLTDPSALGELHSLWRGTTHTDVEAFALVIRACASWTSTALELASTTAGQLQLLADRERTITGRRR